MSTPELGHWVQLSRSGKAELRPFRCPEESPGGIAHGPAVVHPIGDPPLSVAAPPKRQIGPAGVTDDLWGAGEAEAKLVRVEAGLLVGRDDRGRVLGLKIDLHEVLLARDSRVHVRFHDLVP